ncbi:MAG: twin-arginine translocase TatA/TatE family subunit [Lachnospiraceae bacterium]|jgi:sec-independent protein translocase protein TatA|nr:twin-arginine translocase TatA/TatE family subunit [Lachnospiraceae bacterium]
MHIGVQELIIILLIAAVVFGGTKISGLGKAIGKSVREFKDEVHGKSDDNSSDDKEKVKDE